MLKPLLHARQSAGLCSSYLTEGLLGKCQLPLVAAIVHRLVNKDILVVPKNILLALSRLLCEPLSSVQFSSVTQLCPTLCDPIDCSTPGFSVHHQLPELAQTQL